MIRSATLVAACVLACTSNSALAASQAVATISDLTFTLVDLDPSDGVAPSFSFLSSVGSTVMSINANDNVMDEGDSVFRKRGGTFSFSYKMLAELSKASAASEVNSNALSARGSASGPSTSYSAMASTGTDNPFFGPLPLNLSLSANAQLLIEASVALSASATNPSPCSSSFFICDGSEVASSSASMSLTYKDLSDTTGGLIINDQRTQFLQASARGTFTSFIWGAEGEEPVIDILPSTEENKVLNDVLKTTFTNSSSGTHQAALGLSVSVSGVGTTAPVPEPETYALAFAGLGVAGLMARRRRRG